MPPRIPVAYSCSRSALLPPVPCLSRPFSRTVSRAKITEKPDDGTINQEYNRWLRGPAQNFRTPLLNETNYLGSYDWRTWQRKNVASLMRVPFHLNPLFKSSNVLSEDAKTDIYRRVVELKRSVRQVSAEMGVSLERVAAVVRLKAVEKEWEKEEKPMATFLAKALHSMLPVTQYTKETGHESIQDMPSHPFSHRQAFVPVSESREYTRKDAGKEFGLPAADDIVPHPDLIVLEKERLASISTEERVARQKDRDRAEAGRHEEEERLRKLKDEAEGKVVETSRWKWRLKMVVTGNVGHRYGVPHQDRKKGQVKIPTRIGY